MQAMDTRHEDMRGSIMDHAQKEVGFICNLSKHWVALRKVRWHSGREVWFNLNSRCPSGPTEVAETWLASFLASASADRDTVFVIRGNYELSKPEVSKKVLGKHQMFLDDKGLQRLQDDEKERVAAEVRAAMKFADRPPPPTSPGPALPGQVNEPWKAVWNAQEGAYYYWNTVTNTTQWEHPSAQVNIDREKLIRFMDLGLCGEWEVLLPELEDEEIAIYRETVVKLGPGITKRCRYVDHVSPEHGQCLLHLAVAQGQAWVVKRLLEDFGAQLYVRSFEGKTAQELAWETGHAAVLGVLMGIPVHAQAALPRVLIELKN
mmetsp:Transcript_33263/g.71293  ORF Transcript_33263/g.71293 Transcript_33263/m.71293 type:complete len:319 (+) Transcript_33263:588-1544(+)